MQVYSRACWQGTENVAAGTSMLEIVREQADRAKLNTEAALQESQ